MSFTSHMQLAKNVRLGDKVNLLALPEAENEDPFTAHCLVPGAEYKDLPTADCMVPGWGGIDYENGIVSDVLQEVNVTVGISLNCETASKLCTIGPGGPVEVSELTAHTKKSDLFITILLEMDYILIANCRGTLEGHLFVAKLHVGWRLIAMEKARHALSTTQGLLITATG